MLCPKCQRDNPQTAQFCLRCHATLRFICPACKHTQDHGGNCDECGVDFAKYSAMLIFKARDTAEQGRVRSKQRASIVKQTQSAEKKTGQKLSPDRKNNGKGYAASNTRMVPEHLNRGRHHVDGKKLRAWQKRLKKTDTDYEEFYTYLLAKAHETADTALLSLLEDMHPNDIGRFIENEDTES